jgi:hypothetical protein
MVDKPPVRELPESLTLRKDLKMSKIAEVANIGVDQATMILNTIIQQIVSNTILSNINKILLFRLFLRSKEDKLHLTLCCQMKTF